PVSKKFLCLDNTLFCPFASSRVRPFAKTRQASLIDAYIRQQQAMVRLSTLALGLATVTVASAGLLGTTPNHKSLSKRQANQALDPADVPWWAYDADALYHIRYHCWLSMAAYADYDTVCPTVFTYDSLGKAGGDTSQAPWTPIGAFYTESGLQGYQVIIPEMDKVVIVFRGLYGWESLPSEPSSLEALNLGSGCSNCTAHTGALNLYLEAKAATNNWAAAKAAVASTGHKFSVTGHAFGGMVAQIAALDLGYSGNVHYSHSQGAPRVFNAPAAAFYDNLFQGESSQRAVANNDSVVATIPESSNYTFAGTGVYLWGYNSTYGMNMEMCWYDNENPQCAGGTVANDSYYYFTSLGSCGNWTVDIAQEEYLVSSMSAAYAATAVPTTTSSANLTTSTSIMSTSTSTTPLPTTTSTSTSASIPVTTITVQPNQLASSTAIAQSTGAAPATLALDSLTYTAVALFAASCVGFATIF
ncbi:uncharacterized protein L969DRAFT_47419, partial [Mixia osmundae IAM 14324]|uniref:uncharacterized protein n=1 Tax=Mixia osmundae (strain CBS 9802 / IAM 14324 / JCM 22182 / KY 12970) TaxID=764103 RepID=UPI0004A553DD